MTTRAKEIRELGNTGYLEVDSNGNVGIGTDDPRAKLQVNAATGTSTNATDATLMLRESSGSATAGLGSQLSLSFDWNNSGNFLDGAPFIRSYKVNANNTDYNAGLKLGTRTNGVGTATVAMTIDHNQNVGIGTTSPDHKLQIVDSASKTIGGETANFTNAFFSIEADNGSEGLYFDPNEIQASGSLNVFSIGDTRFGTNNIERVRIDSNGNVGIGTSSSNYKLTIAGDPGDDAITLLNLVHTDTDFGNGTGLNHAVNIEFNLPANRGGDTNPRTAALIRGRKGNADWYTGSAGSTNFQGQLAFFTREDDVLTEQMVIDEDGNLILNGDSLALPRSSTDPSGFQAGQIYYNTTDNTIKMYNGSSWSAVYEPPFTATGGSISTSGAYKIHTFTSSGTFTVTQGTANIEYLVIGGGGGGGTVSSVPGGGGGAGGYRCSVVGESSGGGANAEPVVNLGAGTYTITVGAGGTGGPSDNTTGNQGSNSSISGPGISITSIGGGGGGGNQTTPTSGGSGGGGQESDGIGASGTSGQGYAGGNGSESGNYGGGGGGAGEPGSTDGPGHGGDGVASTITGGTITRAGGGGSLAAGAGGGGTGSLANNGAAISAGQANTGGGGGGGASTSTLGTSGGSGIVVIRYQI